MISESLARRLWPEESSASIVGRQFRQDNPESALVTVAGVVEDAQPGAMDREPLPVVYRPYAQWASGPMTLVVKTAQDSAALGPAVRSTIRAMDPDLPILAMRTMREIVSSTVGERQFQMMLTSVFAVLALILGAVGLYGVVSYSVACSTRDIGLRMALGALRTDVIRWVFSHGMQPVLVGLFAGLVGAVAVARALRSLLFEVAPTDPLALGVVSLVLLLASGTSPAICLPAEPRGWIPWWRSGPDRVNAALRAANFELRTSNFELAGSEPHGLRPGDGTPLIRVLSQTQDAIGKEYCSIQIQKPFGPSPNSAAGARCPSPLSSGIAAGEEPDKTESRDDQRDSEKDRRLAQPPCRAEQQHHGRHEDEEKDERVG